MDDSLMHAPIHSPICPIYTIDKHAYCVGSEPKPSLSLCFPL